MGYIYIKSVNLIRLHAQFIIIVFAVGMHDAYAQPIRLSPADSIARKRAADSIRSKTSEDYQDMLKQLGITELRPGANGNNAKDPHAANYDESKANPFPQLPDPLILTNGKKITTSKQWFTKRRPQIVEFFDREIYGRQPNDIPLVKWQVDEVIVDTIQGIPVTTSYITGKVEHPTNPNRKVQIKLSLTIPIGAVERIPVVMELSFPMPPGFKSPPPPPNVPRSPGWQEQVLSRGWAVAQLIPVSIQADNGAGLTEGIIGLLNDGNHRKPDDWGALRAWAWGTSRAVDFFESLPQLDAKKVAIEGHSRYGKAALVAMAYDARIAIAFVSSSGEGGAKLHRRNFGELVENLAASGEYHWMAGNFIKYAGPLQWSDLPVDSHELIALCAPRPVFISVGEKGDSWVDAKGNFLSAVYATPVYELLGKKGIPSAEFPKVETGFLEGELSFRQHAGGHTPLPNWPYFLQMANKYFSNK